MNMLNSKTNSTPYVEIKVNFYPEKRIFCSKSLQIRFDLLFLIHILHLK